MEKLNKSRSSIVTIIANLLASPTKSVVIQYMGITATLREKLNKELTVYHELMLYHDSENAIEYNLNIITLSSEGRFLNLRISLVDTNMLSFKKPNAV